MAEKHEETNGRSRRISEWLTPGNIVPVVRLLGGLFALAILGYVWLWKLDWRIEQEREKRADADIGISAKIAELKTLQTEHLRTAEEWKQRILLLEEKINEHKRRHPPGNASNSRASVRP